MITGGAGFIGSHLVAQCIEAGHQVAVLDNFSSGKRLNIPSLAQVYLCLGRRNDGVVDVRDYDAVLQEMKRWRPDVVSHHAAVVDVRWCEDHVDETREVNVQGAENVFRAACEVGVRQFILASSAGGYGECPIPLKEDANLTPVGAYGCSKADAELVVNQVYDTRRKDGHHVPWVTILRYSNVYGARANGGVIPAFLDAAVGSVAPSIFGDGEQVRDFVHVDDVARANLLAMRKVDRDHPFRIVNIASGDPVSINRLWAMVSATFLPSRSAEILMSRIDASLARDALGFEPKVSLRAGLQELMKERERAVPERL